MRTLAVVSPFTKGPEVRRAQEILAGDNVFQQNFLQIDIDDEFGPGCGRACRRAKFWAGFPGATVNSDRVGPIYGPALHAYLTGAKALPPDYVERRNKRLAEAKKKPLREKAFERLAAEIGYVEGPNNDSKFGKWYGLNHNPYCAMAVTQAYCEAGSSCFSRNTRYAYCPYIVDDAKAGKNGLSITKEPQRGDLVLFDWKGDGVADHIGMFEAWIDRSKGTFKSVEANTSPNDNGSQSNGGGVFRRGEAPGRGDTRKMSQVQAFVHVGR